MTDSKALIERLRDYGDRWDFEIHHDRLEAADHIEKLEADLMDAQADSAIGIARIAELEADNARLREALEPFARAQHIVASVDGERIRCVLTYPPEAKQTFTLASLNEARAALEGTSHD